MDGGHRLPIRFTDDGRRTVLMATIEDTIEVEVPITTAYNQWTQFEEFPRFMDGVREVRQLDDRRMHWIAEIGGRTKEWEALVTEQRPDQLVAWEATDGTPNGGAVTFEPLGPDTTRVSVTMGFEPDGVVEKAGTALGVAKHRVHADLERFKELVEQSGDSTGGWRGTV
jgi:uncharacterized membrane protein